MKFHQGGGGGGDTRTLARGGGKGNRPRQAYCRTAFCAAQTNFVHGSISDTQTSIRGRAAAPSSPGATEPVHGLFDRLIAKASEGAHHEGPKLAVLHTSLASSPLKGWREATDNGPVRGLFDAVLARVRVSTASCALQSPLFKESPWNARSNGSMG